MKLKYSEDAKRDLQYFRESLNAFNQSGDTFFDEILVYARKLSDSPKLGASLQSKINLITDLRFLVFPFTKKQIYIIIYRIDETADIIYINRVFDGRVNYLNTLFSNR